MKKTITFLSRRAAMMLLTTMLLTLTAQTAWAQDVVHYYYSINLAFSGGSGTVTMDGREDPLIVGSNSNVGEIMGGVINCHLHIMPADGCKVSSVSYSYIKEGGDIFGPNSCFIDSTPIYYTATISENVWEDIDKENLTFTVNVVFEPIDYSIHVDVQGGPGTVTINNNDVIGYGEIHNVMPRTDIQMTIMPMDGYSISSVTGIFTNSHDDEVGLDIRPAENGYEFTYPDAQIIKRDNPVVTVNVVFSLINYNITYNLDGGTNNNLNPSTYNIEDGPIELKDPTKTGYTFDGWYDNENFAGGPIDIFYADIPSDPKYLQDREFWAKWNANTYTVHFDANGGSGVAMANQDFIYDESQNLTANTYTAPDDTHLFGGWNTKADGSGISYDNEGWVGNLTDKDDATVTLYAQWAKDIDKWCTAEVPNQSQKYTHDEYEINRDLIWYKFDDANNYADVASQTGVVVKDGNTPLTLGTDYRFQSVRYDDGTAEGLFGDPEKVGDKCLLVIEGMGNYAGKLYAPFRIIVSDDNGTWGNLRWVYSDGTLTISKKDGVEGNVAMPDGEDYDNFDWNGVASGVFTLNIDEGITNVGNYAFGSKNGTQHYGNLTTINLPSTLTSIGENAFAYCGGLTIDLNDIPASVTNIGTRAFYWVGKLTATLTALESGSSVERLSSVFAGYDVDVSFSRQFTSGVASTVCLPFDLSYEQMTAAGNFYTFVGVAYDEQNGWVATMQEPTASTLTANTPYLFKPEAGGEVTFMGTIDNVPAVITAGSTTSGDWTFNGTYSHLTYSDGLNGQNIFGFAASDGENDVKAGEFVKAIAGAYFPAFRAYLAYTGSESSLKQARATRGGEAGIPETITVRLIGKSGEIDGIGEIRLSTGEMTFDSNVWYDLNGRRLDGKPTQKGIYINGGHKVAIK